MSIESAPIGWCFVPSRISFFIRPKYYLALIILGYSERDGIFCIPRELKDKLKIKKEVFQICH